MGKASGNGKSCKGLKMANVQSKHVALLKNKKDCADLYRVASRWFSFLRLHNKKFERSCVSFKTNTWEVCWRNKGQE